MAVRRRRLLPSFHTAFLVGGVVAVGGVVCAAFVRSAERPARAVEEVAMRQAD